MTAYAAAIARPPRTLTDVEQARLLKVTGEHRDGFRDHVLFALALGTGLREHELAALDVGDVLHDDGRVRRRIALRTFKRSSSGPATQEVFLPDALWYKLAATTLKQADFALENGNSSEAYDNGYTASSAAINGLLLSESVQDRATGLGALAHALESRSMWREAIATYRASIALVDDGELQARLDKAIELHDRLAYKKLMARVEEFKPDAVVCTHFLPMNVLLAKNLTVFF